MRHPKNGSFYDLLGVRPDATANEIRRAFLLQANRCHPDLNRDNPQAEWQFKQMRRVYEVLSDPLQRAAYDECPARFCLDDVGAAWDDPTVILTEAGKSALGTGPAVGQHRVGRAARTTVTFSLDDPRIRRERQILLSGVLGAGLALLIIVCSMPPSQPRDGDLASSVRRNPPSADAPRHNRPQQPADRASALSAKTRPKPRDNASRTSQPLLVPGPGQLPANPALAGFAVPDAIAPAEPKFGDGMQPAERPLPPWSGTALDWSAMLRLEPAAPFDPAATPWWPPELKRLPASDSNSLATWWDWTAGESPQNPVSIGPQPAPPWSAPLTPAPPFSPNPAAPDWGSTATIGVPDAVASAWSIPADATLDPVGRENLVAGFRALVNPKGNAPAQLVAYRPDSLSPFGTTPAPSFAGPASFMPSGPFAPVAPFSPSGPFTPPAPLQVSGTKLPLGPIPASAPPTVRTRSTRPALPAYYRSTQPAAPRVTWP